MKKGDGESIVGPEVCNKGMQVIKEAMVVLAVEGFYNEQCLMLW